MNSITPSLETVVPLYISNKCDSDCLICSMRKSNRNLFRKELTFDMIREQLDIIRNIEQISALQILTGEYCAGEYRNEVLGKIIKVINYAFEMGYEKINLNIGSLSYKEIEQIKTGIAVDNLKKLGLSVFQETYNIIRYEKYFGKSSDVIPKSKYTYRYEACKRWIEEGFECVNIGILFGVADTSEDVKRLCNHFVELKQLGGKIEISVPRVKGVSNGIQDISDLDYINAVREISQKCADAKIVITTRETIETIGKLLPYISIISPGTSDVGAYTKAGYITNNLDTSQFYIQSKRLRPSWVLDKIMKIHGINKIRYYKE